MTTASEDLDQECIHLLTRRFCALCNGTEDLHRKEHDLEVERVLALPGWFMAKYGGQCAGCGSRFHSGSPISRSEFGGSYLGMCCAPEEECDADAMAEEFARIAFGEDE